MTLLPVLEQFESSDLQSNLQLASSLGSFLRFCGKHPAFKELAESADVPEIRAVIISRVGALASSDDDGVAMHRHDLLIAAYALLLSSHPDENAECATALAASIQLRGWWSGTIARWLAGRIATRQNSATVTFDVSQYLVDDLVSNPRSHTVTEQSIRTLGKRWTTETVRLRNIRAHLSSSTFAPRTRSSAHSAFSEVAVEIIQ